MPPQSYRYAFVANKLLTNIQEPTYQPAPNMLLSTFDMNGENIKEWTILDLEARSHCICLDVPVTNKINAANRIIVLQPDEDTIV